MPTTPSLPANIRAADIMARKLITLSPHTDVFDGIATLVKHRISGAPVVDVEQRLLGVFSEKSCMKVLIDGAYDQLPTTRIDAFMDAQPTTIDPNTDLLAMAQLFFSTSRRRLPVVEEGKLVGQVSRRDVMKATLHLLKGGAPPSASLLYLSAVHSRTEVNLE